MRRPAKQIQDIIADMGRDPSPLEMRMIDQIARMMVEIDKAEASYDRQQPTITQTGCKGQMKTMLNPLAEYLSISRARLTKMLHYLDRHDPKAPEPENELLKDLLDL